MDYDNYEQSYQNLTFSQFGPKDYGQLPVWDARHLGSTVDLSFQYADSREVIPIDIPALLQLQFDRGIRSSSPPFNPGMYTPLSGPYPFGSEQQPVPPQVPANMSQQDMIGGLPDTSFRRWKEHHGRLRQHEHHDSFNNAPMYVPPQPFMESSIFRGRSARDAQHIHPTSASQAHLQPIRSPGPGSTYFPRPSRSLFSGFYDLHLRAPGARVVVDGVDVTDRLNSTSAGTRAKENTNIEPHHHHDGPRNVLNTRIARYLPGQGTRVIRDGRIFRDSNGRRRVVFTDIKLLDDFHQGHHTHDHYLHLLNESRINRLVSRPTPLHAPYTFGPSILPDPFHEIAVDQKGMVVIRKIEGALPMDRRYPNCLCGRPMNNEEIDSGWRLCLNCHMKVRDERNLVDARGRPCLREWLADLFPNAKSCEEYNVPSNKSSWETEEGRERLILTRKGRVPYLEDRGEGARSDQYHARHSHCHGGKGQDTAEAGPSIQSTPAWAREIKAECEQMETRRLKEEHIKSLNHAIRESRYEQSSNAAGPSTTQHQAPTDIVAQQQYLNEEQRFRNQAEADFKPIEEISRQRDNQHPQPSVPDWRRENFQPDARMATTRTNLSTRAM